MKAHDDELRNRLGGAKRLAVLTGAGISQESGIATFRAPDGIWAQFKPEELANVNAFMANPERVWQWYEYRRKVVSEAQPNAGHLALVEFEKYFDIVDIITQNVDGLHARAGSSRVHELHGSLLAHRCLACGLPHEIAPEAGGVPRCSTCGGLIRPSVVWFGEMLPEDVWERAEKASGECDLFFVVGTSAVVYPAAQLPFTAAAHGAYVIEINPERTDFSPYADLTLQGKSGDVLPQLLALMQQIRA